MKQETMKDLVKEVENIVPYKVNEVVEVGIIGRSKKFIFVDVAGVAQGVVPVKEWGEEGNKLEIGEKTLAHVMQMENKDGQVLLSLKRADQQRFTATLNQKYKNKEALSVKGVEANKGGLLCEYGFIRGFLPVSQLSFEHYPRVAGDKSKILARLRELIGKTLDVKIIGFDNKTNHPIFSEKAAAGSAPLNLKKDDILEGEVSGITDFGIFVNLGNFDGLVHISEASWMRVDDLSKIAKVGDKLRVKVINIEGGRVFLSLKRLTADPFLKAVEKMKEGQKIAGSVTKIMPFGAFVALKNAEGLVKSNDLDGKSKLEEGKKYEFIIDGIDKKARKIALKMSKTKVSEKKSIKKRKSATAGKKTKKEKGG